MEATAIKNQAPGIKSYRLILREILVEKQKKNPKFSLRSFAKLLGIQASFLSLILSGKRDVSEEMLGQIVEKLNLDATTGRELGILLRLEKIKNPTQRAQALEDLKQLRPDLSDVRDLSGDQFKVISEWYHLPIQILIDLPDFTWTDEAAAKAIGISVHEVKLALERLSSLEMIDWMPGQTPKAVSRPVMIQSPEHNQALKIYHEAMMIKNIEALYSQAPDVRLTGTLDVALSVGQLESARAILMDAQKKILKICQTSASKKEIYHVSVNLFQLSTLNPNKPKNSPRSKK